MTPSSLFAAASAAAGGGTVRDAFSGSGDAVDGVLPTIVIEPETAEGVAAVLAWASRDRLATVIRGAGTKDGWGRTPPRVDVLLHLRRLNRVIEHAHDDLTVTVEAGARLSDVNGVLAAHGQWLPLNPPFAGQATIGGLLATNDAGPRRHRAGTPRDLVIGSRIATTDGQLSKSGGRVVKNVAGYDLSKMLCGSCGTLAASISATFKVVPRPDVSTTVVVAVPDVQVLVQCVSDMLASQLEPAALDIAVTATPRSRHAATSLLVRFASVAPAVDEQTRATVDLATKAGAGCRLASDDDEAAIWREHDAASWAGDGAVVRLSWLPAQLEAAIGELSRLASSAEVRLAGRAGVGAGLLRIDAEAAGHAGVIAALRASSVFGHVVIARAPSGTKARLDPWGPLGDRTPLLTALKHQFDPAGILNAGRGPL